MAESINAERADMEYCVRVCLCECVYLYRETYSYRYLNKRKEKEKKMCRVNKHECIKDSENEWIGKWVKRQTNRPTEDR